MESLFIEIDKEVFRSSNNIIIGVVYRPTNTDVDEFSDHMNNIVSILKTERKSCYLLGDFNLNLLNADTHSPTQEFIDLMYSDSLFPTITKPTRVTSHSANLIDNIFCNNILNAQALSGILYTDISDHYPIFYIDHSLKTLSMMYISPRGHTHHKTSLNLKQTLKIIIGQVYYYILKHRLHIHNFTKNFLYIRQLFSS